MTTPAISGGAKVNANFLPGVETSGVPAILDFCHIASRPIANARHASTSHVISQSRKNGWVFAMYAATIAVTPINMPPYPGTAVKLVERSIVSRINSRLSIARRPRLTGSWLSGFGIAVVLAIVRSNYTKLSYLSSTLYYKVDFFSDFPISSFVELLVNLLIYVQKIARIALHCTACGHLLHIDTLTNTG